MQEKKKVRSDSKMSLHPRSRHRSRYDLDRLIAVHPDLGRFVFLNAHGDRSVDFFDPQAVLALNKALVLEYYGIDHWEIPTGYLCPPIPGRADYIHHMADVLKDGNQGVIPRGPGIRCLDIGVGASCVYPIIGRSEYEWSFICSDTDTSALDSAKNIIASNPLLTDNVHCRLQTRSGDILHGILRKGELVDLVICNPPFHASAAKARAASIRKLSNLKGKKVSRPVLNFGGQSNELWTEGGEKRFIRSLIKESTQFAKSCYCYSTLVSKESNVKPIIKALAKAKVQEYKVIPMGQGNKVSRIVTWTFLSPEEKKSWVMSQG
jgi:23S rRNA (adenine1618-N6)-methyltransferase